MSVVTDDELFCATLEDLEERVVRARDYDLLRVSALIRQLLLDGVPLVQRVAPRRRSLTFRVRDLEPPPDLGARGFWFAGENLDPEFTMAGGMAMGDVVEIKRAMSPAEVQALAERWKATGTVGPGSGQVHPLRLERFLKLVVVAARERRFSVRDVIRYLAHKAGGVHSEAPSDPTDQALADLASDLRLAENSSVARAVVGIARVAIAGLAPLRDEVLADRTAP